MNSKPWPNVFDPSLYQCKVCKDYLQSKYEGQFVSCKCGNAVDQTKHYTRIIAGKGRQLGDLEIINDTNKKTET